MTFTLLRPSPFEVTDNFIFVIMQRGGTVYILTNKHHTVFYAGVASDILSRAIEHREKHFPTSFTAKYNICKLVYMEHLPSIEEAIDREKQVKKYSRNKKVALIEKINPEWRDLFEDIKDW